VFTHELRAFDTCLQLCLLDLVPLQVLRLLPSQQLVFWHRHFTPSPLDDVMGSMQCVALDSSWKSASLTSPHDGLVAAVLCCGC
jgi:hypothetical protein